MNASEQARVYRIKWQTGERIFHRLEDALKHQHPEAYALLKTIEREEVARGEVDLAANGHAEYDVEHIELE